MHEPKHLYLTGVITGILTGLLSSLTSYGSIIYIVQDENINGRIMAVRLVSILVGAAIGAAVAWIMHKIIKNK